MEFDNHGLPSLSKPLLGRRSYPENRRISTQTPSRTPFDPPVDSELVGFLEGVLEGFREHVDHQDALNELADFCCQSDSRGIQPDYHDLRGQLQYARAVQSGQFGGMESHSDNGGRFPHLQAYAEPVVYADAMSTHPGSVASPLSPAMAPQWTALFSSLPPPPDTPAGSPQRGSHFSPRSANCRSRVASPVPPSGASIVCETEPTEWNRSYACGSARVPIFSRTVSPSLRNEPRLGQGALPAKPLYARTPYSPHGSPLNSPRYGSPQSLSIGSPSGFQRALSDYAVDISKGVSESDSWMPAHDPLQVQGRLRALRNFLEDQFTTVAAGFHRMASLSNSGNLPLLKGCRLTEDDLEHALRTMGYCSNMTLFSRRLLFKNLDVDNDGAISEDDLISALVDEITPLAH